MANKKEQIFHAVIDLMKQEGLLAKIKVADIAKHADVGKGTVYGYFSSKEEILTETILYMLDQTGRNIKEAKYIELSFEDTLKRHIQKIMDVIIENANFHMILMSQNFAGLINQEQKLQIMNRIGEMKLGYQNLLRTFLEKGVSEGVIKNATDRFVINAVSNLIMSSIMDYLHYEAIFQMTKTELVNRIYQLTLKITA